MMIQPKRTIILTGFMGSGKTTTGIRLSYCLRLPLVDTDKWIEKEQGRSVSAIFGQEGEEAFRRMETEALKSLCRTKDIRVIATGGGLPMREENRTLLRKLGCVVYLRVSPKIVYQRLSGDTTRPLLQKEDPEAEICRLLAMRGPAYEAGADLIVDVDEKEVSQIAEEILERMAALRNTEKEAGI